MASAKSQQLSPVLLALEKVIRQAAERDSSFARRLREKNLTVQVKLRDDSQGRLLLFRDGVVSSRKGVHADADLTLSFHSAELAARLLKPIRDRLDFLHAFKNFQMTAQGLRREHRLVLGRC